MPNWCYNNLTVVGPEKDIIELREKEIDFEYFYPTPTNLCDADGTIVGKDVIDWRTEHWGTKWNVSNLFIKNIMKYTDVDGEEIEEIDTNILEAKFDTAWTPPVEFFKHYLRGHPECRIKLEYGVLEMNMSGLVILEMKDDKIIEKVMDWESFDTFFYQCNDA